jgi:hypothetical protein
VKISGLKSAPEYNGAVGLVLTEPGDDGNGVIRQQVRLFKHKKVIHVRESNMDLSHDERDWIIPSKKIKITLLELISAEKSLGRQDVCHKFAEDLWSTMAELPPAQPLTLDHGKTFRKDLMDATGHKLFWLGLNPAAHHFVLEKMNGSWRVFQSYVSEYTAADWCFGGRVMQGNIAWSKWGGGKILIDKEVNELLDLVVEWQELVALLLKRVLLKRVPGIDDRTAHWLAGSPLDAPEEFRKNAGHEIEKIRMWSKKYQDQIEPLGCTVFGGGGMQSQKGPPIRIFIGTEHIFSIPSSLYERCNILNQKLTGEPVPPSIFFNMLSTGVWWEFIRDPETGGAIGFFVRALDIDNIIV